MTTGANTPGAWRNGRALVDSSGGIRPDSAVGAEGEHGATQPAWLDDLRRISDLHLALANATRALAQNLEAAVAVGTEVGLMSDVEAPLIETPPKSDLLTTQELCALLHLHARTVRRMELLDELPSPIRTAGRKRWLRTTIEAWLAEREGSSQ